MAQALHAETRVIMLGGARLERRLRNWPMEPAWVTVLPDGVRQSVTALSEAIGFSAINALRR